MPSHNGFHSPLINRWGLALKLCREKKGFTVHQIASNINVSDEDVQLWEVDGSTPSRTKLARLYGMMPQLRHFKEYLSLQAVKAATITEAIAQRRAARKESKAKEEPMTFAQALLASRNQRNWSQSETAKKIGVSGASLCSIEKGRGTPSPTTYAGILQVFPELKKIAPPEKALYRTRLSPEPKPAPPVPSRAVPAIEALFEPVSAVPVPAVQETLSLPEVPVVAPEPTQLEVLAIEYARALSEAAKAYIRNEEAQVAYLEAEERYKVATARGNELLKRLQDAAAKGAPSMSR